MHKTQRNDIRSYIWSSLVNITSLKAIASLTALFRVLSVVRTTILNAPVMHLETARMLSNIKMLIKRMQLSPNGQANDGILKAENMAMVEWEIYNLIPCTF